MLFGVNYLEEVKELFEEGKIDFIDYFKLYSINNDLSPLDWCAKNRFVMFHGFLGENGSSIIDRHFFSNRDIEKQKEILIKSKTPYMSLHISNHTYEDLHEEEGLKLSIENINKMKEIFNCNLLLENTTGKYGESIDNFFVRPSFIKRVLDETNCNFLLDTTHARVAANALNMPFADYLSQLPLDKVNEIHLTGAYRNKDGKLVDAHTKMNEEDYALLKELLKRCKNLRAVTLEYGPVKPHDDSPMVSYGVVSKEAKEEVLEQLLRLKEILNK